MKQPPQKPVSKREIRGFLLRVLVLLLMTGGIFWLGWKSRWARADTQVTVEAPDAPHAVAASAPVMPTTPAAQTEPDRSSTQREPVQQSESVDRVREGHSEDKPTKPRRRHRAHKPSMNESATTENNT
jgi:hypothetical protein